MELHIFAASFFENAGVAKLVDALDLGSSAARHGGSSPSARTQQKSRNGLFFMP